MKYLSERHILVTIPASASEDEVNALLRDLDDTPVVLDAELDYEPEFS